jgi:hypothetical protein
MPPLMILLAFFAGFFLIFAVNYALADVAEAHRQRYQRRLEQEMRQRRQAAVRASLAKSICSRPPTWACRTRPLGLRGASAWSN